MNDLMLDATQNNISLSKEERDNYLGESQVLLSFMQFNSIKGMSEYHRRACALMSRPTHCLDLKSPWTFGAPSVLSLYHRDAGALDNENADMKDCMPWYEKISEGHGSGAEYVFAAETCFFRGNLDEAKIELYRAVKEAEEKEQYSILAASIFLAARMDLINGNFEHTQKSLKNFRNRLKQAGQLFLLTTLDMCEAWCYAMLGRPDYAPDWVADSPALSIKEPACPSFLTVRDQLRLARGEYHHIIAYSERRSALFKKTHAIIPAIYFHIQLAGANLAIKRPADALRELRTAFDMAEPDCLLLPFAENMPYIYDLLKDLEMPRKTSARLRAMAGRFEESRKAILKKHFPLRWESELTKREIEVANLAVRRMTITEIADALYVSKNTVKTHLQHIYDKLNITGTGHNKTIILEKIAK